MFDWGYGGALYEVFPIIMERRETRDDENVIEPHIAGSNCNDELLVTDNVVSCITTTLSCIDLILVVFRMIEEDNYTLC